MCLSQTVCAILLLGLVLLTACGKPNDAAVTVSQHATAADNVVAANTATAVASTPTNSPDPLPSPTLAPNFSFSNVSLHYDEMLIRSVTAEKIPAQLRALDGSPMYLSGVPDFIQITFEHAEEDPRHATMLIQPVRSPAGEIYPQTPEWHREQIVQIEALLSTAAPALIDNHSSHVQLQSFKSGHGIRRVTDSPDKFTAVSPQAGDLYYTFDGMTEDGIYLVQLIYAVDLADTVANKQPTDRAQRARLAPTVADAQFDPTLAALDQMIASLTIDPNASTAATTPTNPPGCINDAEFIADITVPDGSIIDSGEPVVKSWRLRNSGTCIWTPDYGVTYVEGDALDLGDSTIAEIASPGTETDIIVTFTAPETAATYKGTWQLTAPDGSHFGTTFYVKFAIPEPPDTLDGYGRVEGTISYPAGGLPPMIIYFERTDGSERYALQTEDGWNRYANDVPVGDYVVFAQVNGDTSGTGGGYTQFVLCGQTANCDDHSLVPVTVLEHHTTRGIDVADWYAPAGSFPIPEPPAAPVATTEPQINTSPSP